MASLLMDDATFASILLIICMVAYGKEMFQWDPLELYLRLEEDFGVKLSEDAESKLQAIILAVETSAFYDDPAAFKAICNTLSSGDPGFFIDDELTLPEIFWGFYEVDLMHGDEELSPACFSLIEKELGNAAEDPETSQNPYQFMVGYVEERRTEMMVQLGKLGIPASFLPDVTVGAGLPNQTAQILAAADVQ